MAETLNVSGEVTYTLKNDKGEILVSETIKNLVVTGGKTYIVSRMKDATTTAVSHLAVGTGTNSPALGDTTLQTELARVAMSGGTGSVTTGTNTITFASTFGAGVGTGTLTELGVFNDPTAGTMLCRAKFSGAGIIKGAPDSLDVSWTITIG